MDNLGMDVNELPPSQSVNGVFPTANVPIILYRHRWVILAIFSLLTMMNEVIWISLSSVADIVRRYYQVSTTAINWLAIVFSAMYITVVLAVYILNKHGLKVTIITGALCNAVASIIRLLGYKRNGFTFAFIGNIFGGIGQAFLMFVPPTLSAIWFGEKERGRASAIGMLMNIFGVAMGFLMGSLFVHDSSVKVIRDGMFTTLRAQAVVSCILLIISVVFLRRTPPTPPTHSQINRIRRHDEKRRIRTQYKSMESSEENNQQLEGNKTHYEREIELTQSTGLFKNWKRLLTDGSFHSLAQAWGLNTGLFAVVTTLLNQMTVTQFPDQQKLIGIMGFTATLFGLVSMMLAGIWIDKTHRYKLLSVGIFVGCVASFLLFTLVLKYSKNFAATYFCFCLYGFFGYSYLAVGLEYTAEIMYPIKESILSFILLSIGVTYGMVFTYIAGFVIENAGADFAGYIITGLYLAGLICIVLVKGELKRQKVDSEVVQNNQCSDM